MDRAERLRIFLTKNIFTPVSGFTLSDWARLLWQEHFRIAPRYIPRAVLITMSSLLNSTIKRRENNTYAGVLGTTQIKPPIFILGHWRSGTTHLHNLISVDTQFAYPNFFQTTQPHTFLTTEERTSQSTMLKHLTPRTRIIDNMRASLDAPMEDEVALCILCSLSPILSSIFPRHMTHYDRYLTFREATDDEIEHWKQAFVYLLRKLTIKYNKPLVLKSPPHTCRIRLLLELFPNARFIHIHRNPYAVFLSYKRSTQIMNKLIQLQMPDLSELDDRIIQQYRSMYDVFFEERNLIPAGHFHEIAYEDLEKSPVNQVRAVYETLDIPGFAAMEPGLTAYLGTLADYKKSKLPELENGLKKKIAETWARYFSEWEYTP